MITIDPFHPEEYTRKRLAQMRKEDQGTGTAKQRSFAIALTRELGIPVKTSHIKSLSKEQLHTVITEALALQAERAEQEAGK